MMQGLEELRARENFARGISEDARVQKNFLARDKPHTKNFKRCRSSGMQELRRASSHEKKPRKRTSA